MPEVTPSALPRGQSAMVWSGLAVIEDGTGPGRNNAGRPGVKCDLRLCVEAALEEAADSDPLCLLMCPFGN